MSSRNIRLCIAYDGSSYSGWQRQSNAVTIQGEIEKRLRQMTGEAVTLHGAGRTDAGVHAKGMIANFMTASSIPCRGFQNGLNSMLPLDIRILETDAVEPDFHSRYNATGKTYSYSFCTEPVQLPTKRLYSAHYPGSFEYAAVLSVLALLLGTHDFSSFEAVGSRDPLQPGRGAERTLYKATLVHLDKSDQKTWVFSFTGDGFLRHMVRNIVGTLMEVGTGKMTPEDFEAIMNSCSRAEAGPTAPACGLVLEKVHYTPLSLTR